MHRTKGRTLIIDRVKSLRLSAQTMNLTRPSTIGPYRWHEIQLAKTTYIDEFELAALAEIGGAELIRPLFD